MDPHSGLHSQPRGDSDTSIAHVPEHSPTSSLASAIPRAGGRHARGGRFGLAAEPARRGGFRDSDPEGKPHSPRPSDHLSNSSRSPLAPRPLRSEARPEGSVQGRIARFHPRLPAAYRDDLGAKVFPHRPESVRISARRSIRPPAQRTVATHRPRRRRVVSHPLDAHRGHQPRSGHDPPSDGAPAGRTAIDGILALLRTGK